MEKMFGPSKIGRHIELPPISQIVMVTKDCNRMAKEYSSLLGIGTWNIYEFTPEKTWFMGKPAYLKLLIAKAMSNSIELVLQQPLEASFSLYDDFLSTRGEGVLNFAFNISNYEETFGKFLKAGFEPILECDTYMETPKGYLKSCYFDTRSVYGILLEIRWRSW